MFYTSDIFAKLIKRQKGCITVGKEVLAVCSVALYMAHKELKHRGAATRLQTLQLMEHHGSKATLAPYGVAAEKKMVTKEFADTILAAINAFGYFNGEARDSLQRAIDASFEGILLPHPFPEEMVAE